MTEQMQDPVGGEELKLAIEGATSLGGLLSRELRAEHDVAEYTRGKLLVLFGAAQFIHREGQHIGRVGEVHPLNVEFFHPRLVDDRDAQFAVIGDTDERKEEGGKTGKCVGIAVDATLIDHGDACHCSRFWSYLS